MPFEKIENYKDKNPPLDIRNYFNSTVKAWGLIKNWRGQVFRRFDVEMKGIWKDQKGTLTEIFRFDDGEIQERIWNVEFIDDNNFTAKASDSVGKAYGQQRGFALNMKYTLSVPLKGKTISIKLDDWMYLLNEKRLMNISTMKKFGLPVGKIFIYFEK